ncbi:MAG: shikimate kinase [Rhabdochlamydiaceae bacterium]|nr:shikimate kinase [Candidatus Amphrikana amoebophyrae]
MMIGFKGSGKSLLGKQLALTLHRTFFDSDKVLEHHYFVNEKKRLKCRAIFRTHGEPYFRALEKEVLSLLDKKDDCIIALGGGSLSHETEEIVSQMGTLIYLTLPKKIVLDRQTTHNSEEFEKIYIKRKSLFEKHAHHTMEGFNHGI